MVRLAPGHPSIIDEVPAGRLYVDAGVLTPENGNALKERRHAAFNGALTVSVVLDAKGKLVSGPQVRSLGLPGDEEYPLDDSLDDLADEAEQAIRKIPGEDRAFDEIVEQAICRVVKKAAYRIWERKPVVEAVVLRI
jgi:ribonuclease J